MDIFALIAHFKETSAD